MIYSIFKISILSILALFVGIVSAAEPNVPTEAPYIVLNENLDEPNGYGFCLDTYGPGQSELMQTHSCKPKRIKALLEMIQAMMFVLNTTQKPKKLVLMPLKAIACKF